MNNTKKVIIWVICVIAAIAVFIGGFLLISNYINKKPERLAESFKEKISGTWTGDYDISEVTFNNDNSVQLKLLGIELSGTFTVSYDKETEQYSMNISYNSDIGISVSRDFTNVKLDEINNTISLNDKESGVVITLKRKNTENSTDNITTQNNDTEKKNDSASSDKAFQKNLLGKWINSNDNGGYCFYEDGSVDVSLSNINAKGTYSVSKDDDGKTRIKISYKTSIGMSISNSYYAQIKDDVLALSQVGAENIVLKYTRG